MNGRKLCQIALAFAAVASAAVSTSAMAGGHYHGGARVGVGVYVGPGWRMGTRLGSGWGPGWGPYACDPYYGPATIRPPSSRCRRRIRPQYIEQGADGNPVPAPSASGAPNDSPNAWWYHCDSPEGFYPYVRECPTGWQRVPPTPSSSTTPQGRVPGATS